jgi:uncharacterized MAPEG superfamily protein
MNHAITAEIYWTTLTILMTALFWMPYIIDRILEHGLWTAVSNPQPDTPPKSAWAGRMMKGHRNAVENLAIFAPLALAVSFTGVGTSATATACVVYFFARLAHFLIYTLGIPLMRTLTFFIGFVCQVVLALALINAA